MNFSHSVLQWSCHPEKVSIALRTGFQNYWAENIFVLMFLFKHLPGAELNRKRYSLEVFLKTTISCSTKTCQRTIRRIPLMISTHPIPSCCTCSINHSVCSLLFVERRTIGWRKSKERLCDFTLVWLLTSAINLYSCVWEDEMFLMGTLLDFLNFQRVIFVEGLSYFSYALNGIKKLWQAPMCFCEQLVYICKRGWVDFKFQVWFDSICKSSTLFLNT